MLKTLREVSLETGYALAWLREECHEYHLVATKVKGEWGVTSEALERWQRSNRRRKEVYRTSIERANEAFRLARMGVGSAAIANRLGVSRRTTQRYLRSR